MKSALLQTAITCAVLQWASIVYGLPTAPDLSDGWEKQLPSHPRLVLTDLRLAELKERIATDPFLDEWTAKLRSDAVAALCEPLPNRKLDGRRMLWVSRQCMRRLLLWSMAYRLDGDERFLKAATRELDAITVFSDWNPSHYLDTAEMATGVALAYDWLYMALSADQRQRIVAALQGKALETFRQRASELAAMSHNWNSVCHGGITLAALAIAESAPDEAAEALRAAIPAFASIESTYAPDGVFTEGPAYWDYGTSYLCLTADALDTAWGSTFGLDEIPGVKQSARFMEALTSPHGRTFNFADCYDLPRTLNFATAWLGARSGDAFLLNRYAERARRSVSSGEKSHETQRFAPLALLFTALAPAQEENLATPPLAMAGRGPVPVAAMRTSWSNPKAAYLAIKGGSPGFSHGHMDVGSFVYDWNGIRWFLDPDRQSYETLEAAGFTKLFDVSQESRRWEVFANGSESHNILRFDQCRQDVRGVARDLTFEEGAMPKATLDLTPVYSEQVLSLKRSASLSPEGRATIEDRWTLRPDREDAEVAWQFVTPAAVEPLADGVLLSLQGHRLRVQVLEPGPLQVVVTAADSLIQSHDAPNPGLTRVQFLARHTDRFLVEIIPQHPAPDEPDAQAP